MELREPPRPSAASRPDRTVVVLLAVLIVMTVATAALVHVRSGGVADPGAVELSRELGSRLKAAGALDEAAGQYERYLARAVELDDVERARIAYSLGSVFLERGDHGKALRWFYEADLQGAGDLSEELGRKIVHTLERLGRFHAAQSTLESRVRFDDGSEGDVQRPSGDPVVARIGQEEIYRSDVERAMDELPPELARTLETPADRQEFARQYVAEKLLWRKARKLEYDQDPAVVRRHEAALERLAVSRLVEEEIIARITVDETDLRNFFEAHGERYRQPAGEGEAPVDPTFEQVRRLVERDYRAIKVQSGYQALIEEELSAEAVELFPENMGDGR